jgi:hypothetical protein
VNCLNYSESLRINLNYLDFLLYFLTGLIFLLSYVFFFLVFCPTFLKIIESYFSAGLLMFILGHLGLSTGFFDR